MEKYLINYGSSHSDDGEFISTSRDARKHGSELLGSDEYATGGYVVVYATRKIKRKKVNVLVGKIIGTGRNDDISESLVEDILERKLPWMEELKKLEIISMARYTPENEWYNCCIE